MSKFIVLNRAGYTSDKKLMVVNVEFITNVHPDAGGGCTVFVHGGYNVSVQESFTQVVEYLGAKELFSELMERKRMKQVPICTAEPEPLG